MNFYLRKYLLTLSTSPQSTALWNFNNFGTRLWVILRNETVFETCFVIDPTFFFFDVGGVDLPQSG